MVECCFFYDCAGQLCFILVDILLKTNLAVRPLPELEIEQEYHAQQDVYKRQEYTVATIL